MAGWQLILYYIINIFEPILVYSHKFLFEPMLSTKNYKSELIP